ncbi:serine aminopeptidase S33 family [Stackebrandtia endophytica]|uniref:Serine aminopeptidase S33 family n=1 Tax=Stackebrandtia endophytica TaxID=1496996 RepID=A0A543B2W9_9ACTN|nr:alpha/beta fold hydrolase [Stackebrandtia endophytica]TQL79171.1 serine aminopeptidase S33 family [Stackebrandtia endophytica]
MSEVPLTLTTGDGVRLRGRHLPAESDLAIVIAHGFSGSCNSPRARHIAATLHRFGAVVAFDFRGHGNSEGVSTVGDLEVHDIEAAVAFARSRGHSTVAVAGFSMGAAVAVRHAALFGGLTAVAAVSGPAHWYYRGTPSMRLVHRAIEGRWGRAVARWTRRTRISAVGWDPPPSPPWELVHKIAPTPLLIVHGTADRYFPLRHAHALYESAADPRALWIEPGMGHAESSMTPALVRRLGAWLREPSVPPVSPPA